MSVACKTCIPIEQMGFSEVVARVRRAEAQLQATDLPDHARNALHDVLRRCEARLRVLRQVN